MAFNPVHHFRKYRKFWMASVLLLCMITFVLCTGVGGDLSTLILDRFRPKQGTVLAKLNGRDIYSEELYQIKTRRNAANEFMRKASDLILKATLEKRKKLDAKGVDLKEGQAELIDLTRIQMDYTARLQRPRYFGGGVKLEDLVDFKMWLLEADRLGIRMSPDDVNLALQMELNVDKTQFTDYDSRIVMNDVRRTFTGVNDRVILEALRDEFRARLAVIARATSMFDDRVTKSYRTPYSPNQLWQYYKTSRSEFDVGLVPVPVEMLAKDIPEPTEAELQAFFERYRKNEYNPTSPTPGFMIPERIKVEWVLADPDSAPYRNAAKVIRLLETIPVFDFRPSVGIPVTAVLWSMALPAERKGFHDQFLAEVEKLARQIPDADQKVRNLPRTSSEFVHRLLDFRMLESDREAALGVTAFLAAAARPDALLAAPLAMRSAIYLPHRQEYDAYIKKEIEARAPIYTAAVAAAPSTLFSLPALWLAAEDQKVLVPFALKEDRYRDDKVKAVAQRLASENMIALKKVLDNPRVRGNRLALERKLIEMAKEFSFERHKTKEFFDEYTISKAKELEPLRKSFDKYYWHVNVIESRVGTDRQLGENDFGKLFFAKGEAISVADAPYVPHPWPPVLSIRPTPQMVAKPGTMRDATTEARILQQRIQAEAMHGQPKTQTFELYNEASMPILFWKAEDQKASVPESLTEVRDRVVKAWKLDKARSQVLARAKKIAEALQQPGTTPVVAETTAREQAKALGQTMIYLPNVAPLVPDQMSEDGAREYRTYRLPKDLIPYARKDTVKDILGLADPKGPIEVKYPSLDSDRKPTEVPYTALNDLNQQLFDTYQKSIGANKVADKRFVQVLTNQPHTMFYVAVLVRDPAPDMGDFEFAYEHAVPKVNAATDQFIFQAYEEISKNEHQKVLEQMREEYGWYVDTSPENRKSFDSDVG